MLTRKFTAPLADAKAAEGKLQVEILAADKKPILRWSASSPVDGNPDFVPAAGIREASPVPDEKLGVQELFLAAQADEKEGRPLEAVRRYKEALDRDPKYIPALLQMALEAYRAADFASARDYAAKAHPSTLLTLKSAYTSRDRARSGKRTLAEDHLWASIRFGGSPAPAYARLGENRHHQKDYARAQELLRKSLSYNPGDASRERLGRGLETRREAERECRRRPRPRG